ncbi:MAG: hypothetical protein BWY75_03326 [bacterium ADurb.Bin425]|nr:MAG: hypothetical protein BWY75_03326 [bacterium ADurb.Bin425]
MKEYTATTDHGFSVFGNMSGQMPANSFNSLLFAARIAQRRAKKLFFAARPFGTDNKRLVSFSHMTIISPA